MAPERVLEPLAEASFRSGLLIGGIVLIIGILVALAWRWRHDGPLPGAGLLFATAGAVVLHQVGQPVSGLATGLLALAAAGLVADVAPRARVALPLLALPGALVVATTVEVGQDWAPWAIGATIALGGALVAAFDAGPGAPRRLGPGMMAVSLVGVFLTVPETEEALPVLGATLPLALLGWPSGLATLGAGGALSATGLLAWTVGQGGAFRDSAIVGGLACLGLLVAEPVGRRLSRSARSASARSVARNAPHWALIAVLAVHAAVVVVAARVAGVGDDLGSAVALAVVALFAGTGLSAAVTHAMSGRGRHGAGRSMGEW